MRGSFRVQRLLSGLICCAAFNSSLPVRAQAPHSSSASPSPAAIAEFQKGTEALQSNQPDEAVQDFQQVTQQSPRFAEAYLNLGLAYARLSKHEDAIQSLEKGIEIKPSMRGAHLFLAIAEYNLSRFDEAALAIRDAALMTPIERASIASVGRGRVLFL